MIGLPHVYRPGRQTLLRLCAIVVAAASLLTLSSCDRRQGYPNRPIVLISPWAAGGGTDRVARHLAVLLEKEMGVPVNVVNATGGAGVTGHSRGALARPDGYSMTLMTVEINMLHHRGLTTISHKDFAPVAMVNRDAAALFVRSDAPYKNLVDLETAVRKHPRKLRASGTARGGIWHVALAGWLTKAGLGAGDIVWVPINGSAPSLGQLLAGGVDVVSCSLPEARTLLESGKIRSLGVMSDARVPGFDVPTLAEQGRDFQLGAWRGLGLPGGTPEAIRKQVQDAVAKVITSEAYTGFMRDQGFAPAAMVGEGFMRALQDIDQQMGVLVKDEAIAGSNAVQFGPMLFPGLLAGILFLSVVAMAVSARKQNATGEETGKQSSKQGPPITPLRALELLAVVAFYFLASEPLGYLVCATLCLVFLAWRLGTRLPVAAAIAVAMVPLTYQLFSIGLRVPLPRGLLGW